MAKNQPEASLSQLVILDWQDVRLRILDWLVDVVTTPRVWASRSHPQVWWFNHQPQQFLLFSWLQVQAPPIKHNLLAVADHDRPEWFLKKNIIRCCIP